MKIIGNTVGMGLPKPNLKQTDPSKGDYVHGKEIIPPHNVVIVTESTTKDEMVTILNEAWSGNKIVVLNKHAGGGHKLYYYAGNDYFFCVIDGVTEEAIYDRRNGTWTYNTVESGAGGGDIFVGDANTTLAEFKAAYDSGKTCFLRRSNPSGAVTYTAYNVTSTNAFFFAINSTGAIEYGYLDSDNVFTAQERKHVTSINEKSTDDQIPTAKAVYDVGKGKLDASALPEAVNDALAQAKASGEFDGKDGQDGKPGADGYTPVKGVDYFDGQPGADGKDGADGDPGKDGKDGVSVTHSWNGTTLTVTSASGTSSSNLKGTKGDKGDTGAAGKSAYQYAKENGYTGTETEFGIKLAKDIPAVTQEAGQSTSLVMSQKAVTDLVADALENISKTEYETVNSVDEMTDTSKSYVLKSTGTVWAYGETAPKPAYTNLATEFQEGYRLNSSGTTSAQSGATTCLDYIPVDSGDVVRVKGFGALGDYSSTTYKSDKSVSNSSKASGWTSDASYAYDSTENVVTLTVKSSTVKFIRVSGELTGTTADVIITKNEEIKMTAGYGWYDTYMTPESTGNGNYVDLLVKINQNASDIAEVSNQVAALASESGTLTVPSFWQNAVDVCISKIKALQVGRNCITFPFFSDNHQRNGYAGVLIAKVMEECKIPYCFYGGDSISSGTIADEATMIEQDALFDSMMKVIPNGRFCRAVGNHDGYWYDGTNKYYYNRDQIYDLFLREEAIAQNKHFGDDGTYYYVDDIASKVRFIVLNTNGGSVDDTQIAWFRDTALKVDSGWAAVVISHQPISNHYHALISNAADVRAVATGSGVDIIGWFSGHIHRDRIYTGAATNTTDDSQGTEMGFTQVTITSDHTGIAYDDATKHTIANDDKSHAIDFVTINRSTRTVSLTRLGIGGDRSYTY